MTERLLVTVDDAADAVVVEADEEQVTLRLDAGRVVPLDRRELVAAIDEGKEAA